MRKHGAQFCQYRRFFFSLCPPNRVLGWKDIERNNEAIPWALWERSLECKENLSSQPLEFFSQRKPTQIIDELLKGGRSESWNAPSIWSWLPLTRCTNFTPTGIASGCISNRLCHNWKKYINNDVLLNMSFFRVQPVASSCWKQYYKERIESFHGPQRVFVQRQSCRESSAQ